MVLAQPREKVSDPDAGSTRRLPAVERQAKMSDLRTRIPGVIIEQQLEPSHALLDLVSQQWESQQLEYIPPEECSSRSWEVTRAKSSTMQQLLPAT